MKKRFGCDCVDETYELMDIFAHTCTHLLMVSGWAFPSFNDSFESSHHAWILVLYLTRILFLQHVRLKLKRNIVCPFELPTCGCHGRSAL